MFSLSEDHMLSATCLYDFTIKVNKYENGASFTAVGIYLKHSNKWT